MEDGADWGMKREEVNNRREVGRRGRRKRKTAEDDRKTGNLSINYNSTAARDSHRNSVQRRSHGDMRRSRVGKIHGKSKEVCGDLHRRNREICT